ncbi:hypothetical protein DCAR_0416018 [Daucus carota subsp. sativus]|uniref:non-specific serine/threonine protein kinase n=1 Tax=Daucus carota subsp. sativus TaxID=79200 RepID=A0AAF0WV53_DAUCS|nr:hypothetical protein DCAR_0416018 [Daucus carota subsp. sativus]
MLIKFLTLFLLFTQLNCSKTHTWIRAGYWYVGKEFPVPEINSALFTHLICAFAHLNPNTYELSLLSADEPYISTFTNIVKRKNPSVITLLSAWTRDNNSSTLPLMVTQSSRRRSFIESSINIARKYEFQGLELYANAILSMGINMTNLGTLLDEWRAAIDLEAKTSKQPRLILTMSGYYSPRQSSTSYPIDALRRNLDWITIKAYDYHLPSKENYTAAHAALYDPSSRLNTDYGIKEWIKSGLPANKLVLGLAYHGYAWTLVNSTHNSIGSPARGPALTEDGSMAYWYIKKFISSSRAASEYNATYVVNYCTIKSNWIGYDDVDAIKTKVAYAKGLGLLGYNVWQVPNDDNWMLSKAAAGLEDKHAKRKGWMLIVWPTAAVIAFLLGTMMLLRRKPKPLSYISVNQLLNRGKKSSSPDLQVFSFAVMKEATNEFSMNNRVGEGGYGPVYKGKLQDGQEIAVKRLSQKSKQGVEEFENEVALTAKLQHVNLVRLLGFCTEREEKMLIYEYMPNKSLDFYMFEPTARSMVQWENWVHIIEGVIQGLLYLQEYSRLTIIHRDLKASNILLDAAMRPKISDFGIARSFQKDEIEGNTTKIVGTYFGVILLQIVSGKKCTHLYGATRRLNLLEYAYDLWKAGKGMEFMDPSLNDTTSSCKLLRCMQVALLCVQEKWAERPTMLDISSMLRNETEVIPIPERPAFSTDGNGEAMRFTAEDVMSVDIATISQVVPR